MTRTHIAVAVATVAAASAIAGEARAQAVTATVVAPAPAAAAPAGEGDVRLPVSYTERGITNPEKILSPEVDFTLSHVAVFAPVVAGEPAISTPVVAGLAVGAGYSITNDFGVRATVLTLDFNPKFQYPGFVVGATYRFLKGDFELGVALDANVITISGAGGAEILPSAPMRVHFGKKAILDLQPGIFIDTPGSVIVGLNVPVAFAYDIVEPNIHIGVNTGVTFAFNTPTGATFGDFFAVPLGIFGGYAFAGPHGAMLDIDPFFEWVGFFTGQSGNAVDAAAWQTGIRATYYLYF